MERPVTDEDVRAVVADAAASGTPIAPRGHGTRAGLGRPVEHRPLDLSAVTGIVAYEPAELVLTARAGTPLAEIAVAVDAAGQELAFEPPLAGLAHGEAGAGTVGGLVATALSGPRRIRAGALRDHVLGVTAVSGRGEIFRAGGKVVKNVTGYDLSKGLAGSFGTLAVLTEVTLKVMPKAETAATVLLAGLSDARAVAAMTAAMGAPVDVSAASHLPAPAAARLGFPAAVTLLRLEGVAPSVEERAGRLAGLLKPFGTAERLGSAETARIFAALRDGALFADNRDHPLWRVSVAPTAGPAIAAAVPDAATVVYDWSGGLVLLAVDPAAPDAHAARVRAAVAAAGGGHATLLRGAPDLRLRVPPFEPQPAALAALARRLKAEFDPAGILNPGRMDF
ncbi:glycolate oxidase subunit GlcE [Oharaeibacter diazotrophicus]|uniref:Glycolate oxidase FAD binding subunit n=3 Tax=Oharaeibacter diazotrophicus TaxID=1920512 RepID=A0A4R6RBG6_9HYPH|nr:glycolate oxidase subunit GlcE [Oharaeibacter diazotrophicus]TDP83483.1 glycolate oxidase FAD binding subunit [Oharaeibacter diazotrophicus]BBE72315.1 putative FAD-linked oxidoreductase [Pleomorphomonas sp. SM30]GLS79085.1 2-hydroxy-acid oxidase [Oharaeibacter diazotrophicus]